MTDAERAHLRERGIGITNLVRRATARADELSREELNDGGERLLELVARRRPPVVAIAGVTAYRDAFRERRAQAGRQQQTPEQVALWSGAACGCFRTRVASTRMRPWRA